MSTRAIIGVKNKDGSIIATRVQHDGYPEHTGERLNTGYNSETKALELINMGEIHSLDKTIKETEFYFRDFGEKWESVKPLIFENQEEFEEIIKKHSDFEYSYLFENSSWICEEL